MLKLLRAHQAFAFESWRLTDGCLQFCDVGLVVLVMVDLHRGCVNEWLQGIWRKRQGWKLV
jgi:hypothetical protein